MKKLFVDKKNVPYFNETFENDLNVREWTIYGDISVNKDNNSLSWTVPANTIINPYELMIVSDRWVPSYSDRASVCGAFIGGSELIRTGYGLIWDENNYIMVHSRAGVGKITIVKDGNLITYSGNNTITSSYRIRLDYVFSISRAYFFRARPLWGALPPNVLVHMPKTPVRAFIGTIQSDGSNTSDINVSLADFNMFNSTYSEPIPVIPPEFNRFPYKVKGSKIKTRYQL